MFKYLYCYFTFTLLAELQVFETDYLEDMNCPRKVWNGVYLPGHSVMLYKQPKSPLLQELILVKCKEG